MTAPKRVIRLIALDLDGTLLDRQGQLSPADAAALRQQQQRGVLVVLASGRMTDSIRKVAAALGLNGPIIAYNGARVTDGQARSGRILLHRPLPARYADELIAYAKEQRFHLNYYLEEVLYGVDTPELRPFADLYTRQTGSQFCFVDDLERFRGCAPTKIILITEPPRRDELYRFWQEKWGQKVWVTTTNPEYLEFLHKEASKGAALEVIAREYGIPQQETMAFGDGRNDIPMLQWAGLGVAVANAESECKQAADYVSAFTNDESAVARAIAELAE